MEQKVKILLLGMAILPFTVFAQGGIEVQTGTYLVSSSTAKIILAEGADFNNSGTFTHGNGEVIFLGNAEQEINGTSTSSFYDLNINKSAGNLIAASNFNVAHQLKMTSGKLDLQNATVDLGTTGEIIDETAATAIMVSNPGSHSGTIKRTADITDVGVFTNIGNIGIGIKPSSSLGQVTIVRGHYEQQGTGNYTDNYSIARYFEISPTNNVASDLLFYFWDGELTAGTTNHSKTDLIAFRYISSTSIWEPVSATIDAGSNNYIGFTTPGFSKFTLASKTSPLPIELLSLNVKWYNEKQQEAVVNWVTASEINNDYFVVERSADAVNWENIATTQGAGSVSYESQYEIIDKQPLDGISYYRLKQVDFDGTTTYSDLRTLSKNQDNIDFVVYPNPTSDVIYIQFGENPESSLKKINLYDQAGKIVRQLIPANEITNNTITIDVSQLAPGTYNISIEQNSSITNHKIVINN